VANRRTLFVTQDFPPDRGGIARLYAELCSRIPHVEVSTVAGDDAQMGDVPVHRMSFPFSQAHRPVNILRWARWARQHAERHDVALLHVGNIRPAGYVAAILRRQAGIPYIVYVHGKDLLKERRKGSNRWIVRAGTREILGNAAAIVANSTATARIAREILDGLGRSDACHRVHVVHPGADPARFTPSAQGSALWRRRVAGDGPLLLSVARLVPRKGIDTVIESLPAILAAHPSATYVVVGTGPDLARLQSLAHAMGVADCVRFVGDIADDALPVCYAAADIFLLPTREILADDEIEGFGIAYVEAAAAAVPSIAAGAGGVGDAVADGVTGLLVAPGCAVSVAEAAIRILGDPVLRARLGGNGRRTVERDLNWDRAALEVQSIVESVMRTPVQPASAITVDAVLQRGIERREGGSA
jgi:phosphatidylinositol alpha-1,6-mannosyltransferase